MSRKCRPFPIRPTEDALRFALFGFACCTSFLLLSGCSPTPSSTPIATKTPIVEVGGTVLLDGQPVANGSVVFLPTRVWNRDEHRQTVCFGETDEEGKFQLIQGKGTAGVVPGNYRILISKVESEEQQQVMERNNQLARDFFDWSNSGEETPCCWPELSSEKIPAIYNEMSMLQYYVIDNSKKVELRFNLTTVDPTLAGKAEKLIEEK